MRSPTTQSLAAFRFNILPHRFVRREGLPTRRSLKAAITVVQSQHVRQREQGRKESEGFICGIQRA